MAEQKKIHKWNGNERQAVDPEVQCSYPGGGLFEIHVGGQLDSRWSEWLQGLEVQLLDHGEMILKGRIVDQAALMGILNKLSRLNLNLISVNEVKPTNG